MELDFSDSNGQWSPVRDPYAAAKDRRTDALGDLRVLSDEILCTIATTLAPRDVGGLSCVSSIVNRLLEYKGSWKKTALHQLGLLDKYNESCKRTLHFDGFNSLFLYRRLYRCYTSLNGFSFDDGNVERRKNPSLEEFHQGYDGKKPVLISGLADNWPARKSWTTEQLLLKYSDIKFRISQRSQKKININFKDYIAYMQVQHDEDPLYIFDDKFGEAAPDLMKDYTLPHLFQEDYFDVLDIDQRPPFRWLIIGPERSGASWHVDPGLTSAWNTILCGRKRWALYPPGRVPLGVTVHVNEDNGDVNIETPTSLQWWLDYYPLLAGDDKPIECTQLPGETIYVPSGWWHCVLNLETTIAVTQNFVNSRNFEFVCMDMAPGYRHKGVCRAGLLALDGAGFETIRNSALYTKNSSSYSDLARKEKRVRTCQSLENTYSDNCRNGLPISDGLGDSEYSYDINFLSMLIDKEMDHYTSLWSSSNCIGQREMRDWLWKLWVRKPGLRDLIWKGACLALNAGNWYERVGAICTFHEIPSPLCDDKLPVGTGSNPVYLNGDYVIKIFAEDGLEACLYGLGTELEFHNLLNNQNSPLKNFIPSVLVSGILLFENGLYRVLPWDGRGIPEVIASSSLVSIKQKELDYPFGVWGKKQIEHQNAGKPLHELGDCGKNTLMWPYIVTKRCRGRIFSVLRDTLSLEVVLNLASFLGEQLHNLHLLPVPCPSLHESVGEEEYIQPLHINVNAADKIDHSAEWKLFRFWNHCARVSLICSLSCPSNILRGDPIPSNLIEKVHEYIPRELNVFLNNFQTETEIRKSWTWIHSDVMNDNVYMAPCSPASLSGEITDPFLTAKPQVEGSNREAGSWYPSHILDFSNLTIGEPLLDLIPLYLDIFRGDPHLLKQFLDSYKLPLVRKMSPANAAVDTRFGRLSYRAMFYCILHEDNLLGAIFGLWKELRTAKSWKEVEEKVWVPWRLLLNCVLTNVFLTF